MIFKRHLCCSGGRVQERRDSWYKSHFRHRCSAERGFEKCAKCGTYTVTLPSDTALLAMEASKAASKAVTVPNNLNETAVVFDTGVTNKKTHLAKLPTEILLQIFRLLVPTKEIFHITPASRGPKWYVSVHRVVHHATDIFAVNVSTMSVLCRRLRDITYTIFYGANQFVFEISTKSLVSHVRRAYQGTEDIESAPPLFESWSKFVNLTPTALAPLNISTASFLTNLTICIHAHSTQTWRGQKWSKLEEWMQSIGSMLGQGGSCELKHLVIGVGISYPESCHFDRDVSNALEFDDDRGLPMRIRKDWDAISGGMEPRIGRRCDDLVKSLECLRGLRTAELVGLVSEQYASKFRQVVTSTSAQQSETGRYPKRRRLNVSA